MTEHIIFQTVLLIIGIGSTILVAYLFRYVWIPKQEKTFEKNQEQTIALIFYHLSYIDSYKQTIFDYLEEQEGFDFKKETLCKLSEYRYNEIIRFRKLIYDEVKILSDAQKFTTYVTVDQYLAIQRYAISAYSFMIHVSNVEFGLSIDKKAFEYHMHYAKNIIELIGKYVPKWFKEKWESEFIKQGGIRFIVKPEMEPGDIITSHHNFHNEILNHDVKYQSLLKKLEGIEKELTGLKTELNQKDTD